MDEHPTPPPAPPLRIVVLQTTTDILNQTTSIFSTRNNLLMFLLLSFLFFLQRLHIDHTTHSLTSYIDNQPAIKSYYSPIPNSITISRCLTRVTTLHDDQFPPTSLILYSFHPQFNYEIRSSKFTFKSIQTDTVSDEINVSVSINQTPDSTALLFPFGVFCVSYCYLIIGFFVTQSFLHGVIFVLVLNDFCRRRQYSFLAIFLNGCSLGYIRSLDFMFMRFVVRYVFTLFLGIWFFGGIEDQYSLLKIVVRLTFMPHSIFTPWVKGFEEETQGFITTWLLVDFFVSYILTLGPWILMGDSRRKNVKEAVKEGWDLMWLKFLPGFNLKCYESLVCGPLGRLVLARALGDVFAIAFQGLMEVYFLFAWFLCYLSVKSFEANSSGQPFGQPQLQAMLVDDT